jgi:hypothetical protein
VSEAPFKATLKAGAGYEAPWITVDGDNAADLEAKLDGLTDSVLTKVAEVAELLRAAHTVVVGSGQPATTGQTQTQSATVTSNGGSGLKTCEHGVRVKREGTSSKGKWTGYFCALPKGSAGACDPVWD